MLKAKQANIFSVNILLLVKKKIQYLPTISILVKKINFFPFHVLVFTRRTSHKKKIAVLHIREFGMETNTVVHRRSCPWRAEAKWSGSMMTTRSVFMALVNIPPHHNHLRKQYCVLMQSVCDTTQTWVWLQNASPSFAPALGQHEAQWEAHLWDRVGILCSLLGSYPGTKQMVCCTTSIKFVFSCSALCSWRNQRSCKIA